MGTGIELAYFDQMRDQLDPERTVFESIADGADFIEIGSARKHVLGYLQDFLFPPDRARTPVAALSGGSEIACCSPGCSLDRSTFSCSTSRRTTSTSRRWICSRSFCSNSRGRWWSSATIAPFSTTS
jgi:ATP-binding cassette subfamily F protein uup